MIEAQEVQHEQFLKHMNWLITNTTTTRSHHDEEQVQASIRPRVIQKLFLKQVKQASKQVSNPKRHDWYSKEALAQALDDESITALEEGFMRGYLSA